ncbi:MAG: N-acetyl sugar amidotransferase [Acidobacteria bacterium]|nr:N-acetyl sugar amidotransferase [Acidobacteriota bacterium]
MQYCVKCVYPAVAATPLTFDQHGVCTGCRVAEMPRAIDWNGRWRLFEALVEEYRSASGYDILIPVSGGKDSYFQTHVAVKRLGLKPLLVTYHGNNYLPEGEDNLHRMREVFDCDHIIVRPGVDVLIKMNRIGFRLQGDMNWHAHCGIFTSPIQVAVRYKVPLILWGEHGFMDLGGMYSYNDFVEFTAKHRLEHALRGFDWHDFTALVMREYGWRAAEQPFERTYRTMSNLDDMHENGIHDYLKFVKFGYGRATDHACKDIRSGLMTRAEGIEKVRTYDHVKPRRDLTRWLDYVGMSEREFDAVCDTFRDPRIWRAEDGQWVKENVWRRPSAYGPVSQPLTSVAR